MRKLAGAVAAGREVKIENFDLSPEEWLGNLRAKAALSLSPLAEADERRKIREMIQAITGTIFAEDLSRMRYLSLEEPDGYDNPYDDTLEIKKQDGSIFALRGPIMVAGTFATPSVRPDLTAAIARTGAAIALGAIAPPAAALPFLQFGSGEAFSCAPKIESASRFVRAERG